MPAKKKAEAPAETKVEKVEAPKAPADHRLVAGKLIDDETAQRNAREAAVIEREKSVKPDAQGDIDARMAALLKDHEAMGARPK